MRSKWFVFGFVGTLVAALLMPITAHAEAPVNHYLAQSPWPISHGGPPQQASTNTLGPVQADRVEVQRRSFKSDAGIAFGTSPFHVLSSHKYPSRPTTRTIWGASLTHVYKYVIDGETFTFGGMLPLTRFVSIGWNLFALKGSNGDRIIVPQPRGLRHASHRDSPCYGTSPSLIVLEDGADPTSPIRCTQKLELAEDVIRPMCAVPSGWRYGYSGVFNNVAYSGEIATIVVFVKIGSLGRTKRSYLVLADNALERLKVCTLIGEGASTNQFPVEQTGPQSSAFYIATEGALTRLDFDAGSGKLAVTWRQPTNFRGRTGTTPTLVGFEADKFVVMIDGLCAVSNVFSGKISCSDAKTGPSKFIAIRRNRAAPETFTVDLPDYIRTIENSPSALGMQVALASYGGYRAAPEVKGVASVVWDTRTQQWRLSWANADIQMNGVTSISGGANLVYSSGVETDKQIYMYGVTFSGANAGQVKLRVPIGPADQFLDQGNNTVINDDGSLIYGTAHGIVRLRPK
jgi:hypothetical protein